MSFRGVIFYFWVSKIFEKSNLNEVEFLEVVLGIFLGEGFQDFFDLGVEDLEEKKFDDGHDAVELGEGQVLALASCHKDEVG